MKSRTLFYTLLFVAALFAGCNQSATDDDSSEKDTSQTKSEMQKKVESYANVKLSADLSHLTENQKKMLPILFETAKIMDDIFWSQAYGHRDSLLNAIKNKYTRQYVKINYGPWDRLKGMEPFVEGVGPKPEGANFYPQDMTKEEFEAFEAEDKTSLYTLVRRDEKGELYTLPYHEAYQDQIEKAANLLKQAAELAEDEGFKKYLNLRAEAMLTDNYLDSDLAWMDMKNNAIDFVVGPIENYEDRLFGYKAAHEAFILLKDKAWSDKLTKYSQFLPDLQKSLPVDEKYKQESPGTSSDLGVYQALYYAGDCNAASKTIAINLPNDPRVHVTKGTRKLQLKNAMRAKFDKILVPISKVVIDDQQQKNITFEAFFENTMFHEVAHGLGIKNTINGKGTVREALQATYSPIEEGKADILGLFFVTKLHEMGEFPDKDLMDNYVTFMAGIFRSVRFGISSSHGKANMIRFYYFQEKGAFTRNAETGKYRVNFDKMKEAMLSLSNEIITIQGDGDIEAAQKMIDDMGAIKEELQNDLDKINEMGIPKDIVFEQGIDVLNL